MYRRSWSMEDRVGRAGSVEVGDGTSIAWRVLGSGNLPGLLVVHGGATSSTDYEAVGSLLAETRTVFLVDRRGRGLSRPMGNPAGCIFSLVKATPPPTTSRRSSLRPSKASSTISPKSKTTRRTHLYPFPRNGIGANL